MSEEKVSVVEKRVRRIQNQLDYTDEEIDVFRSDPKKMKALIDGKQFALHEMVVEIIDAHNCVMGYKPGDRFVIDREGALCVDECPPKLCVGAISAFKPLTDRMVQAFYDGKCDVLIDTVHCPDVGIREGGWGMVTMRIRARVRNWEC
ncbi:MAG: hypothetical protein C4576_07340 [Desulfobacteraceae bacterium]|nr:MAG: hypothetical protein C4576_07340 [Desulfobacteraceae bacterium]